VKSVYPILFLIIIPLVSMFILVATDYTQGVNYTISFNSNLNASWINPQGLNYIINFASNMSYYLLPSPKQYYTLTFAQLLDTLRVNPNRVNYYSIFASCIYIFVNDVKRYDYCYYPSFNVRFNIYYNYINGSGYPLGTIDVYTYNKTAASWMYTTSLSLPATESEYATLVINLPAGFTFRFDFPVQGLTSTGSKYTLNMLTLDRVVVQNTSITLFLDKSYTIEAFYDINGVANGGGSGWTAPVFTGSWTIIPYLLQLAIFIVINAPFLFYGKDKATPILVFNTYVFTSVVNNLFWIGVLAMALYSSYVVYRLAFKRQSEEQIIEGED